MPDPYDVLTIAAVADELTATIGGGRVQRIGLIDPRTIGAEIYAGGRRHHLIASADDQLPRLRLAPAMPSLDPALITPFGLLLRKYVRGGVILSVDQPPLERLVRVSIARRLPPPAGARATTPDDSEPGASEFDEDDDLGESDVPLTHVSLYIELMGRRSNLILVDDDGRIMESVKRVTSAMSRVRQILPRLPYQPPPPPDRRDPREITPQTAASLLTGLPPGADLARALVDTFRGISPQMAREIVFRARGAETAQADGQPIEPAALARETLALLAPLQSTHWQPHVYRDEEMVVAVSPITMRHLAVEYDEEPAESISAALALAEGAVARSSPERHAQRRQRLLAAVQAERDKAERRLAALASQGERAEEAERWKAWGDAIYASLWQIVPGQTELVFDGLTIPLDPNLSATENAQAYFERYRKARSAGAQLPELEEEARAELAYLDQMATLIAQAPGFAELEALAAEWAERIPPPPGSRPRRQKAPPRPRPLVDAAGNHVFIGRSGRQNDIVTFDIAGPDDTWLHARGVPGSHVVIRWRTPGMAEVDETVAAAAALAAWNSAARESGAVEVDITRRRYVRKIKGGPPGMVTYRNERTVRVQPAPEERLRDVLSER